MSRLIRKTQKGFTLIELMIVVAIIGILAAIAIPNFLKFQLKSKTSEAKVNLAAIRTAEESYLAEFGQYIDAIASPATNGGTTKQGFSDSGLAGANFDTIGWSPEGQVFFNYAVLTSGLAYTADASADIDGNMTPQVWGYVHENPSGGVITPGRLLCSGTVNSSGAAVVHNTVGPCGSSFGQSEF